jgi:biotin transporter BioY
MLNFVMSLSLESGALLVVLVSVVMALAFASMLRGKVVWFLALLAPLGVAYCLYWFPVWSGQDSSEYSSWALVFIIPWFLAGACASLIVVYVVGRVRRRRATHV